jgi:hypothetical protein
MSEALWPYHSSLSAVDHLMHILWTSSMDTSHLNVYAGILPQCGFSRIPGINSRLRDGSLTFRHAAAKLPTPVGTKFLSIPADNATS